MSDLTFLNVRATAPDPDVVAVVIVATPGGRTRSIDLTRADLVKFLGVAGLVIKGDGA